MRLSDFEKNVLKLSGGTFFAQLLSLAVLPLISRLYTPEEFGFLTLVMVSMNFLAMIYPMKYDQAIILPPRQEEAVNIVFGCFALACLFSLGATILFLCGALDFTIDGYSRFIVLWYLVPIAALSQSCILILQNWHYRRREFGKVSVLKATDALTFTALSTGFGILNLSPGLIIARFASQVLPAAIMLKRFLFEVKHQPLSLSGIIRTLKQYRDFPLFLLSGSILGKGALEMNMFLYSYFFGNKEVGLIGFCTRVLAIPIGVVTLSVGNVFKEQAAREISETGTCKSTFLSTVKKLAVISVVPFGVLFIFGSEIFRVVFGAEWSTSGAYAEILAPSLFLQFIASPVSTIFLIREAQRRYFVWQALFFVLAFASIILGAAYGDTALSLLLFSLTTGIMYSINLFLSFKLSIAK